MYVSSPLDDSLPYLVHNDPNAVRRYDPHFRQYIYTTGVDYGRGENALVNGLYAINRHPSDVPVGFDAGFGAIVYSDAVFPIQPVSSAANRTNEESTSAPTRREYAKSAMAGPSILIASERARLGHHWGWATCHWIRSCNATLEWPGTPCTANLAGVTYHGFCFESSTGSLECGHTTALDDRYGDAPIAIGGSRSPNKMPSDENVVGPTSAATMELSGGPYRCERGADATSLGSHVGKRLLIAGCMISSDISYSIMAEVHVPAYCTYPAQYRPGCMFQAATNYDPLARQPTDCHYNTAGCTSTSAINYNSGAAIDDGSCIEAVEGCTVSEVSYAGVEPTTPGYRSGYFGGIHGKVSETEYGGKTVLNFDPAANVLSGCILAIEGCMDSSAVNFDPQATINSGKWCVPAIYGCMMPDRAHAPAVFSTPSANVRDGLSMTFNPAATVHNASACRVERIGCMDSSMLNYDKRATVNGGCRRRIEGCLNPFAKNFRCAVRQETSCAGDDVQIHSRALCVWSGSMPWPPQPPPPPLPPGRILVRKAVVATRLLVAGEVSDYDAATREQVKQAFASIASMPLSAVDVTISPASVVIEIHITYSTEAEALAAVASIASQLGDAAVASTLLGLSVQSAPQVSAKTVMVDAAYLAPGMPIIPIIGSSVAGIALFLCGVAIMYAKGIGGLGAIGLGRINSATRVKPIPRVEDGGLGNLSMMKTLHVGRTSSVRYAWD